MGNAAGVKRDFDALEKRRLKAAKLLKQGMNEAQVARCAGVHRQSVNRWTQTLASRGRRGLKNAGRAGRKPQLSEADLRKLGRALERGPEAYGYETGLWTLARVAALIEAQSGVSFHPGHVWRVLNQLGWSCQRPTGRVLERDEAAIRQWKRRRWPALKKRPRAGAHDRLRR